jgi:3-hydroxybutyryl-CoA dehydrogenase
VAIKNVGVIGCGLMGSGIVQVTAQAGYSVLFVEANEDLVKRGLGRLKDTLEGLAAKGKLDAKAKDEMLGRIAGTPRLEDLKACDLVIEAMTENQALKNETFAKLDRIAAPHAILASNTSSCNVTALAAATKRPGQVLGMHFFNPVPAQELVELVTHDGTSQAALATCRSVVDGLGKTAIVVRDSPGFATSRLGVAVGLEAIRMLAEGVASAEDIDTGMRLGYRWPMGPLRLTDLIGLDVRLAIAEHLERTLGPRFAPPQLLRDKVARGELGRKSGKGFYEWS